MYICVVCGYDQLDYPQYEDGFAMQTICPCCGFQSGFDDASLEPFTIEEYRVKWIKLGSPLFSSSVSKPKGLN